MKSKLAVVAALVVLASPAVAQLLPQEEPEREPRRGFQPPRGAETPRGAQTPQEGGPLQEPDIPYRFDDVTPRRYEGRATYSGRKMGKCPPNGFVRATILGNRFDARITFPIDAQVLRGTISGTRISAQGELGYSFDGTMFNGTIRGTAEKRATVRPVPPPKPAELIPGPSGLYAPQLRGAPVPPPDDCRYRITMTRVTPTTGPAGTPGY